MKRTRALILMMIVVLVFTFSCVSKNEQVNQQSANAAEDVPTLALGNAVVGGVESPNESTEAAACEKIPLDPVGFPDMLAGGSEVQLDSDGFFVVNGVKFFPFGFYGYPHDALGMEEFVEAGFNTAIFHGGCCQGTGLADHLNQLDWLAQYGVWASGHGFAPVSQIYTEQQATLQSWIDQRASLGNLLFWYTYDEPGIWSIPKQEAEDYHDLLHALDTDHPNALVQCVNEDFTEYIDYTDFMMVDPYPVPWMPLSQVKYTVLEAEAASNGAKRVFGVAQAFDWYIEWGVEPPDHVWRPLESELRNMTYQFLIFGVNGLVYFAYNRITEEPARWAGLKQLAAEVVELMPILLKPEEPIAITETPDVPYVDHTLRELDGNYYLMAVSTWYNDVTVTYDLSPLGAGLCVVEYFSGNPVPVAADGTITIDIAKEAELVLQIIP
jgi:hypothetical protein